MNPTPIQWKNPDVQTPPSDEASAGEKLAILRKWSDRLRNGAPDWQLQAAGADLLDGAAAAIETLQRENRALFDGHQGCIADRARLTEENAALRSGHWPRGVRWRIIVGFLLISFGSGVLGAGIARIIGGCG